MLSFGSLPYFSTETEGNIDYQHISCLDVDYRLFYAFWYPDGFSKCLEWLIGYKRDVAYENAGKDKNPLTPEVQLVYSRLHN